MSFRRARCLIDCRFAVSKFEVSIIDQAADPSGPPADSNVLASLQRSCSKRTPLPVLSRRNCGRSRHKRAIRNRWRAPVVGLVLVLFSVPVLWLEIGPDFGTTHYIYVLAVPVLVSNSGPDFGLARSTKRVPARDKLERGRERRLLAAPLLRTAKRSSFSAPAICRKISQNEFSKHVIPTRSLPDRLSICSLQHLMTLRRGGFGTDRRSQIRYLGAGNSKQCLETVALPMFALMLR